MILAQLRYKIKTLKAKLHRQNDTAYQQTVYGFPKNYNKKKQQFSTIASITLSFKTLLLQLIQICNCFPRLLGLFLHSLFLKVLLVQNKHST